MINYLQSNHNNIGVIKNILTDKFLDKLVKNLKNKKKKKVEIIENECNKYNIQKKEFLSRFISYLITNKIDILNMDLLTSLQYVIHNNNVKEDYLIQYLLEELEYNVL